MKRVLLTGANGFIGKKLAEQLHLSGYWVRGAVRKVGQSQLPFSEIVKVSDPLTLFRRVNVGGTKSLAEQSVEAGVQRDCSAWRKRDIGTAIGSESFG